MAESARVPGESLPSPERSEETYVFGDFELDANLYRLRRSGADVPIEPKSFEVLVHLLRHRERVVLRTELLDAYWPPHVCRTALAHCIADLRKLLNDDAAQQRVIQTTRARGYRFVAAVQAFGQTRPDADPPARRLSRTSAGGSAREASLLGREATLAIIDRTFQQTLNGKASTVLLLGEPGVGKSRIAAEVARETASRGARAFEGRCYEGNGAPAFWPFVQILRALWPIVDPALIKTLGPRAFDLTQLLPEAREQLEAGAIADPPAVTPHQARFRLFEAVTLLLLRCAERYPLVIVVDDLHAADEATLVLFHFLARELGGARVLLLGTARSIALRPGTAAAVLIGDLAREARCQSIALGGISLTDVELLLKRDFDIVCSPQLARVVHRLTAGNPFFIEQVASILVAEGIESSDAEWEPSTTQLPVGVREAVTRRVERLGAACQRALATAAVVGAEFPMQLVGAGSNLAPAELLDALDEAVAARIIERVPTVPGRYLFVHALMRLALYDSISASERVRLHRAIGIALEEGATGEVDVGLLAYHFAQASPGRTSDRAVTYTLAVAERANRALAYEDAARHYERCLQLLEQTFPVDSAQVCTVLLALGFTQQSCGDRQKARITFARAASHARRSARIDQLARAAIGHAGPFVSFGIADAASQDLLEEALAALGREGDQRLRSAALTRLSSIAPHADSVPKRRQMADEALMLARTSKSTRYTMEAMRGWCLAHFGPDRVEARLALANELTALSTKHGERHYMGVGYFHLTIANLELGAMMAAERSCAALETVSTEVGRAPVLWILHLARASLHVARGEFAEAEEWITRGLSTGQRSESPGALAIFHAQRAGLSYLRGRPDPLEEKLRGAALRTPATHFHLRLFEAFLASTPTGDQPPLVQAMFDGLASDDFKDVVVNEHYLYGVALISVLCIRLRDIKRAAILYDALLPFANLVAIDELSLAHAGPVADHLGMLACVLERWDVALEHNRRATAHVEREGMAPFLVLCRLHGAQILLARGDDDDHPEAMRLLALAEADATRLDMVRAAEEARAVRAAASPPETPPVESLLLLA